MPFLGVICAQDELFELCFMNQMAPVAAYPGDQANVDEVLALADQYARCARHLYNGLNAAKPLQVAPARFCAMHALELYRNALARSLGERNADVRSRVHNLYDPVHVAVLRLRKATAKHLYDLSERREYLIARYGPECTDQHLPMDTLLSTLNEVSEKVSKFIAATKVRVAE